MKLTWIYLHKVAMPLGVRESARGIAQEGEVEKRRGDGSSRISAFLRAKFRGEKQGRRLRPSAVQPWVSFFIRCDYG